MRSFLVVQIKKAFKKINVNTDISRVVNKLSAIYSRDGKNIIVASYKAEEAQVHRGIYILNINNEIKDSEQAINAINKHTEEYSDNEYQDIFNHVYKSDCSTIITLDSISINNGYIHEFENSISDVSTTKILANPFLSTSTREYVIPKHGQEVKPNIVIPECDDFDDDLPF